MDWWSKWVAVQWQDVAMAALSTVVVYAAILFYTRIVGLRSFSKMSPVDFAMTVAVGSLFASTISSPSPTLLLGLVSLSALFIGQWLLARIRHRSESFCDVVDNQPLLLMAGNRILDDHLRLANVTREDLYAKLREANALDYSHVLAVVFETTGDISVLHSRDCSARVEPDFIKNVIGSDQLDRQLLKSA